MSYGVVVPQDAKPSILVNMGVANFTRTGAGEQTIYKREIDFTRIDYIFFNTSGKLDGTGSGTGHIRIYIDAVEKQDSQIPTNATSAEYGLIDCTSIYGKHDLYITIEKGTDNLIVQGIYMGVVDA